MVAFEAIREDFEKLRDFFLNDLDRIVGQETGGNYAVAALFAIACEEVARLRFGEPKGERVLEEMLPEDWTLVAPSLYGAIRDGLAHRYETKLLVLDDGDEITVSISWREKERLTAEGWTVFLNAERMVADLRGYFDRYEQALRDSADLRDRFVAKWSEARMIEIKDAVEIGAWRRLLPRPEPDVSVMSFLVRKQTSRP